MLSSLFTISRRAAMAAVIVLAFALPAHAQIQANQIDFGTCSSLQYYAPFDQLCHSPSAGSASNGQVVTSSFTAAAGVVYQANCSAPCTATLPSSISTGFQIALVNIGTAAVTITSGGPTYDGVTTLPPGQQLYAFTDGTNYHSSYPSPGSNGNPNGRIVTGSATAACGEFIRDDATGATTVTLPSVATGCTVSVQRGVSAGVVTIDPGATAYDGVTTQLPQGSAVYIWTDGTGWHSNSPLIIGTGLTWTPGLTGNTLAATGSGGASYTNVVAGTTSDTTVAAINAKCTGGQTYVASVPVTFTAGGTINSGCIVSHWAGGVWSGSVSITFAASVAQVGDPTLFFSGPTVTFSSQAIAPFEWFGAIGDGSVSGNTGTDNTAAMQACLAAKPVQCLMQAKQYKVTSHLSVPDSSVGIGGTSQGYTFGGTPSIIFINSASEDVIDVGGACPTFIKWNKFTNFSIQRSVAWSGSGQIARGLFASCVGGMIIDHVQSEDSKYDFHLHGVPAYGVGLISNSSAGCQYASVSGTCSGSVGWWLEAGDGVGLASSRGSYNTASGNAGGMLGLWLYGDYISDVMWDHFEAAGTTETVRVEYTGFLSGGFAQDIYFDHMIGDQNTTDCASVNGVPANSGGLISFRDPWCAAPSATYGFDCESSISVSITGAQINNVPIGIRANGCPAFMASNNSFNMVGSQTAISLNSLSSASVKGNVIRGPSSGGTGTLMAATSVTNSSLGGNTFYGTASVGLSLDSSSNNNDAINTYPASGITTNVSDSGSGNTTVSGGSLSVNGSAVSGPNANDTTPTIAATTGINNKYQHSGSSVSSYTPVATSSTPGVIKPDGTTCSVTAGVLACPGSGSVAIPLCAPGSASGSTYTCTISSFTVAAGVQIVFKPDVSNSGTAATINVNSSGAAPVAKWQTATTLVANDFRASTYTLMIFDGTNWEAQTIGNAPSGGGSSGYVLLAEIDASASSSLNLMSRNVTGQSGNVFQSDFDDYDVRMTGFTFSTSLIAEMQFSNNGTSCDTASSYGWFEQNQAANTGATSGSGTAIKFMDSNVSTSTFAFNGTGRITTPLVTQQRQFRFDTTDGGITGLGRVIMGTYSTTTALTGLCMIPSTGTFTTGHLRVYGIAK